MAERPILFSAPMVRAILSGAKTQTRRVVKHVPMLGEPLRWCASAAAQEPGWVHIVGDYRRFSPYGEPGDKLWVRETWRAWERNSDCLDHIWFRADDAKIPIPCTQEAGDFVVGNFDRWHPSIHMPRWASRITLEVTGVRVERLTAISEEDARAEGAPTGQMMPMLVNGEKATGMIMDPRRAFAALWDSINGKREGCSWEANPFCWVISFKRVA
jgi:hypothetical protein